MLVGSSDNAQFLKNIYFYTLLSFHCSNAISETFGMTLEAHICQKYSLYSTCIKPRHLVHSLNIPQTSCPSQTRLPLRPASPRWPGFFGLFVRVVPAEEAAARLEAVLPAGPCAACGTRRGPLSAAARPPLLYSDTKYLHKDCWNAGLL